MLADVRERLLGDAEEVDADLGRGPRGRLIVEPVRRRGVAVGHVEGDCERDREALLLEAGRMQVEDQLPEPAIETCTASSASASMPS